MGDGPWLRVSIPIAKKTMTIGRMSAARKWTKILGIACSSLNTLDCNAAYTSQFEDELTSDWPQIFSDTKTRKPQAAKDSGRHNRGPDHSGFCLAESLRGSCRSPGTAGTDLHKCKHSQQAAHSGIGVGRVQRSQNRVQLFDLLGGEGNWIAGLQFDRD